MAVLKRRDPHAKWNNRPAIKTTWDIDQVSMLQEMHSHLYAGKEPLPLPQPVRFCLWQLNVK